MDNAERDDHSQESHSDISKDENKNEETDSSSSSRTNHQSPSLSVLLPLTDVDNAFLDWFQENGGYMSKKIMLGNFEKPFGKGLYVVGDESIAVGEVLLKIPSPMLGLHPKILQAKLVELLQPHGVDLEKIWKEMKARFTFAPNNIVQALGLMWEMSLGADSFYFPYLATLPSVVGLATSFTDDELDLFQNENVARLGREARDAQYDLWHTVLEPVHAVLSSHQAVNNATWWTYDSFDLARQLVSSRNIVLQDGEKFIIPMAEKLNHKPLQVNPYSMSLDHHAKQKTDDGNDVVVIRSDRNVNPHSQVFEDYGNTPNQEMAIYSGFIPSENYGHYVSIPAPQQPFTPQVETLLQILALPHYSELRAHAVDTMVDDRYWQFLDLTLASPDTIDMALMALRLGDVDEMCRVVPVACGEINRDKKKHNMDALYAFVQEGAKTKLSESFSTTLQQDRVLLEQWTNHEIEATPTVRRRNAMLALQFRIKEKEHLERMANANIETTATTGRRSRSHKNNSNMQNNNTLFYALAVVLITVWYNRL